MNISDPRIDDLMTVTEKVRRRKISDTRSADVVSYIDPSNFVAKLCISNNHVIQGRRGSGKTTLLIKRIGSQQNEVSINMDCQPMKTKNGIDILLEIFSKILKNMLTSYSIEDLDIIKKRVGILYGIVAFFIKEKKINRKKAFENKMIYQLLNRTLQSIGAIERMPDEVTINRKVQRTVKEEEGLRNKRKTTVKSRISINAKSRIMKEIDITADMLIQIEGMIESNEEYSKLETTELSDTSIEVITIKKSDILKKTKDGIAQLFNAFYQISSKKIVLYLDDYYLIPENEQIQIVHFLHDVYKLSIDSCFCFKLSVLPYRIKLNPDGNYDLSLKDDFSPIRLDHDLADFENLKNHMLSILINLDPSIGISTQDIRNCYTNDEAINYSIIASGGIPRDFIVLFSDLVTNTRLSGRDEISKVNIYNVVNELKNDKEQNIEFDADISPQKIRESIAEITKKIVEGYKTNVFLYQRERMPEEDNILRNLVNLRYIHPIKENISSETIKKKSFDAYLVDMIFYATGQRMPQGFNFREFWTRDEAQRQPELHRAPILQFDTKI